MPKKVIDIYPPREVKEDLPLVIEEKIKEKRAPEARSDKAGGWKKGLFFTLILAILGFLFLHFALARVSVEIWPETEGLNLDETIRADEKVSAVDLTAEAIPARVIVVEKSASQDFSAQGKSQKEKNAQGTIRIFNNYTQPQTLVANTRFQPPLEKVIYFRTTKRVVVPANGYVDVEVKADQPGEEYNIEPSTFSIPGLAGLPQYYSIYGKSFSAMTGGFKGEVSQVKQEDLDAARKTMLDQLTLTAQASLAQQVSSDFVFLPGALSQEILQASSSVPAGTETSTFKFNAAVKTEAVSFTKSDLDSFVKKLIDSKIQDSGKMLEEKSLKVDYSAETPDATSGSVVLNLKISATVYSDVKADTLKKALLGRSLKEGQVFLQDQPGVVRAELKAFPFWLREIPARESQVNVKLNTGY
jgi:hypothetical protein